MLAKIVSVISMFILLFISSSPLPSTSNVIEEDHENLNINRNADEINGANGTKFFIERPKTEILNTVNASQFGLSTDNNDNYTAFQKALDYCKENPFTKLVIDNGIYYFRNAKTLNINCSDVLIDGSDATFIFSATGTRFDLINCDCVEIRNLNIDWNWDENPLASVVTVKNSSPDENTIELEFKDAKFCRENTKFSAISMCDPENFTFGAEGENKEIYLYQNKEYIEEFTKISENTLKVKHNGCMDNFQDGETYILRHYVYDGTVFGLAKKSKNLTFDEVNIYGGAGTAYYGHQNISHYQIINSYIGVNPEFADERHVSLGADGIHLCDTSGFFNIENCDMSRMGDDCINIHDNIGYVKKVDGNTVQFISARMRMEVGDTIAFKDENFNDIDFSAKIVSARTIEGYSKEIVFDRDVSKYVFENYTTYSKECDSGNYVIRNNYFHENRARALLLQSSNGLCENNRFYKIMGQAIKVIMDIEPNAWLEGTGVDNLIIRNNVFDNCDVVEWGAIIEIGTNLDGRDAEAVVFTNIEITDNTFTNISQRVLESNNVNNLILKNNIIEADKANFDKNHAKLRFKEYCFNVTFNDNTVVNDGFLGTRKIVQADNVKTWAFINSQI